MLWSKDLYSPLAICNQLGRSLSTNAVFNNSKCCSLTCLSWGPTNSFVKLLESFILWDQYKAIHIKIASPDQDICWAHNDHNVYNILFKSHTKIAKLHNPLYLCVCAVCKQKACFSSVLWFSWKHICLWCVEIIFICIYLYVNDDFYTHFHATLMQCIR